MKPGRLQSVGSQIDTIEQLTHTHTHTHTYNMPCQVMANTMKKIIKQCREMKK